MGGPRNIKNLLIRPSNVKRWKSLHPTASITDRRKQCHIHEGALLLLLNMLRISIYSSRSQRNRQATALHQSRMFFNLHWWGGSLTIGGNHTPILVTWQPRRVEALQPLFSWLRFFMSRSCQKKTLSITYTFPYVVGVLGRLDYSSHQTMDQFSSRAVLLKLQCM